MKKIKQLVILLFMCFILSGCNVTYNLNIDGDKLSEDVTIRYNDSTLTYDYINNQFPNLPVDYNDTIDSDDLENINLKFELYDRKITAYNNEYVINYKYDNFNRKTINKSNVAKHAFNFFQYVVTYDKDIDPINGKDNVGTIEIVTNNVMNVYETNGILQNVTVNVTTNRRVLEHNADAVNGNTYTWYYSRNNYKKNISLKMYYEDTKTLIPPKDDEKEEKDPVIKDQDTSDDDSKQDKNKKITSPIILVLFFLSFIVVLLFVIKLKK